MDQPPRPAHDAPLDPGAPFADSTDENRISKPLPYEGPIAGAFAPYLQSPLYTQRPGKEEV